MTRIPTLDGWRGIAIALVLFDHIQDALLHHYIRPWTQTGAHGVTIFFVLSGFLITSNLIENPIDLKRFYLRRFFRLMPAAWILLAALLLLGWHSHPPMLPTSELLSCIFFYRNYYMAAGVAGHFWSLSLEEQFYIVWPCVLLLAGVRRSRWIALVGVLGCASCRWIFSAYYNRFLYRDQAQFRADSLLVGCLLALLLANPRVREVIIQWSRFCVLPALATLLIFASRFLVSLPESIAVAALIASTSLHPDSILARPFRFPSLAYLGTVSYSLYLWQEFFMRDWTGWMAVLVFGVLMPAAALGSYYLVERPFNRLGHWLTRDKSCDEESKSTVIHHLDGNPLMEPK